MNMFFKRQKEDTDNKNKPQGGKAALKQVEKPVDADSDSINLDDPELLAEKLLVEVNKDIKEPDEIPLPDSVQLDRILKEEPVSEVKPPPKPPAVKKEVKTDLKSKTAALGNLDDIFNMAEDEAKAPGYELSGLLPDVSIDEIFEELNKTNLLINKLRRC
jgi:hypothetical protein